jgi:hypothetical protein
VGRLLVTCAATLLAAWGAPALASAGLPNVELEGVVSERAVRDVVHDDAARREVPARVETFVDSHGHRITIGTNIATVDLAWYAGVLQGTLHAAEIEQVLVEVVPWASIEAVCGGAGAVGCYFPAQRLIVVPDTDPNGINELIHTIVHEYGHHVDGQLENLGHLDASCAGRDGSRNWWWHRVPDAFACSSDRWELLIGELYAEDYTALNGVVGWHLPTIGPPTAADARNIVHDFNTRFAPRSFARSRFVRRDGRARWTLSVKHWTRLTAAVRGPRRADLDLFLYRRGRSAPLGRSLGPGSLERIARTVRPGTYVIAVRAVGAGGRARVRVELE